MSHQRGWPNAGHFYSNIVVPTKVDIQFAVNAADSGGAGITSLKSNGYVQSVFMHTSATPATGSPNPAAGYALITMKSNFNVFTGAKMSIESPVTGSALAINGSALTAGVPYQITTVGAVPQPTFTVTSVADSSGSLASKYWTFSDQFNNSYVVYYVVAGVGSAPSLIGALNGYTAIQVSIASSDTANTVAGNTRTALAAATHVTITGSTNQIIVTGAATDSSTQFSNVPNAQTSGFTVGAITFTSLVNDWHHVGFPLGFVPSVGAAFYATATGGATNTTGRVKALGLSGVLGYEIVGVSNQLIANSNIAANAGAQVLIKFLDPAGAVANPADTSIVNLSLEFDQSSVTIDGL